MKKKYSILLVLILALLTAFFGVPGEEEAYIPAAEDIVATQVQDDGSTLISADGIYTSKEDVALYIHTYGCLPQNFMTKDEARNLGWEGGSLEEFAPGMCIGGDRFGNYEGLLPDAPGRKWTECDVNYEGGFRGSERILFSNDGLIYYTDDHYESFTQLY